MIIISIIIISSGSLWNFLGASWELLAASETIREPLGILRVSGSFWERLEVLRSLRGFWERLARFG
eukprot:7819081-Karenia_brevis.AAC.1